MVTKDTKKKTKLPKREPTPASVLKKVATISDSNKTLQKEIKVMTKIFGENQKVLISMKSMIDSLVSTLENIQKQSKQINMLEEDAQKLYAGLNQLRTQSDLVAKINNQTEKLEEEINKINDLQKSSPKIKEVSQQVDDSINSIRNNSQMIIKIAQRIDEVKEDLNRVSGKTDSFLDVRKNIEELNKNIHTIQDRTKKIEDDSIVSNLKGEFEKIVNSVKTMEKTKTELSEIKKSIDILSLKAAKADSFKEIIENMKQQFETVFTKIRSSDDINETAIREIGGKIDKIETEISTLTQRTDTTAFVGEGLKSIQEDFSNFKKNVYDKTNSIDQKISSVNETLKKQDSTTLEFHKKSETLFEEIQYIKNRTDGISDNSSKEMMALLQLSKYQSNVRMLSESKYGSIKDLENIATQTSEMSTLFARLKVESEDPISLPHEVLQWAITKILECADRWEIRFSDLFATLRDRLGRDVLKDSIRIQQVRDIYGIRAVDEIRNELGIS